MFVRRLITVFTVLAIALFGAFIIEQVWLQPVRVESSSMKPALNANDRVLINVRSRARQFHRGDIVVLALEANPPASAKFSGPQLGIKVRDLLFASRADRHARFVVKRIVGLPGETIQATRGVVIIDNVRKLREKYLTGSARLDAEFQPIALRADEYYVLGDNRANSRDSRAFGPVPKSSILGVVRARIWPLRDFGEVTR